MSCEILFTDGKSDEYRWLQDEIFFPTFTQHVTSCVKFTLR
jgi:hypothetical protein